MPREVKFGENGILSFAETDEGEIRVKQ